MLSSTENRGFHLTFTNGLTISVQFGTMNYCNNHGRGSIFNERKQSITSCENAEVAILDADGCWITSEFTENATEDVLGYLSADEVGVLIERVRTYNRNTSTRTMGD